MFSTRFWLLAGSLNMALTIVLGAFGAHALKQTLSAELFTIYQTAVYYHQLHAMGLLVIGVLSLFVHRLFFLQLAASLLLLGIILFSGSLYALALVGIRGLGIITPIGGLAFIGGWLCLTWAIWQDYKHLP